MSDSRKYYVYCEDKCMFEGMTKEQIYAAIEQAISTGEISDVDTGFVTKIKEQNKGIALSFWIGTQAEYNAITEKVNNCFYIITDDTTSTDINKDIEEIKDKLSQLDTVYAKTSELEAYAKTSDLEAYVTTKDFESNIGDIETALDNIIAIQEDTISA